jgi:hypothetical protein
VKIKSVNRTKAKAVPLHATKTLGGEEIKLVLILDLSTNGVSGQRHAPAALYLVERTPGTHCTGGWVGPRAGLDTEVRGKDPLASAGD